MFTTNLLNVKFLPAAVAGGARAILLLVHGRGGRLLLFDFMVKRGRLKIFDILSLEAPHPDFVPEMKVPGFSWFVLPEKKGLEESRMKLSQLLEELEAAGYARDKIFWLGFSQGAVMGLDTALRSDYSLGGVVGVSGFCLQPDEYPKAFGAAAKKTPLLLTTGTRDLIVPGEPAQKDFLRLKDMGVNLEIREYDKPHSFDLKREVPEIEDWLSLRLSD